MGNGLAFYKRYTRDFFDGTIGMPFELKGAYALIIDLIFHHSGHLRDCPKYVSGQLGCSVRKWNKMRLELINQRKIYIQNGNICNERAILELVKLGLLEDNLENAEKKLNKNNDVFLQDTDTETPNPLKGDLPAALFEDFWKAYPSSGRGAKRKAAVQWSRLTKAKSRKAIAALAEYIATSKRITTAATYLRDEAFENVTVTPLGNVPDQGTVERAVYDLIDDPQSWRNFFSKGVTFDGQAIIVSTAIRKEKIDRFAGVLASEGFEVRAAA